MKLKLKNIRLREMLKIHDYMCQNQNPGLLNSEVFVFLLSSWPLSLKVSSVLYTSYFIKFNSSETKHKYTL